jgi:hypothetical protein
MAKMIAINAHDSLIKKSVMSSMENDPPFSGG